MKTKELINNTFDKVIKRLQKDELIEISLSGKQVGMSSGAVPQVWDEALDKQTDKNITKICKEKLK